MAEITNTKIATSDPLNLCNGFALFPKLTTARLGYVGSGIAGKIFSFENQNLLLFRLSVNAKYEAVVGVCGPAYAMEMEVEGSTDNGELTLTVEGDEIQAGLLFGVTLSLVLNLSLDYMHLKWVHAGWKSHFARSWSRLLNVHINLEFDPIEWMVYCYKVVTGKEDKETAFKKVTHISNELIASWGMYDERKGNFISNGGELDAAPTYNIPVDISSMVEPIALLNLSLKALLSHLSFGPLFGIQIPVKVKMKSVTVYDTKYSNLHFNGYTVTGTKTGTDPDYPREINVELEHTAGFDLALGVFLNLNLVKLFNVGFSVTWPLLKLLGIEPKLGPHTNNLSNTIGEKTVETCGECAAIFEVIFEPPGGLTI